ncbi:hypothetical protein [Caulobacter sp. S45]|uniref:hypothetical protein n=1 Tax=Caulobacter sp. S45 TaxID=1641861 RepID=UPI00131B2295|nr:hypothetical protein [Caulobacter sp. S45]
MKTGIQALMGAVLALSPAVATAQVFYGSPGGLVGVGSGNDCPRLGFRSAHPRTVYDQTSHEHVTIAGGCVSGYIKAVNDDTGQKWRVDFYPAGIFVGVDEDGDHWRYDPHAKLFINLKTGRSCPRSAPRHVCGADAS